MPRTHIVAFVLVALAAFSGSVAAQTEDQDVHLRNDCRLAAQILETGHPAPHYAWATGIIPKCAETGGAVLAQVWSNPPSDSMTLDRLFHASYTLRDRRVTIAVAAAAANQTLPQLVRLNAIRVLTGHAVPEFMVTVEQMTPVENAAVRVHLGGMSHVSVRQGAHPIRPEDVEVTILPTLTELRNDRDERIVRAATYVLDQVCGWLKARSPG